MLIDSHIRYSYYSADDNALNESPLSLSQERYNQLLGFTITSAIMAFALAIAAAKIYARARRRYALVVPAQSDHSSSPAPSFWMWLWRDLTTSEPKLSTDTNAASPKPVQPSLGQQPFRRVAKKGYVKRADLAIDSMPPTPQQVVAALENSEYYRALSQELEKKERLAQMSKDENAGLGLQVPSNLLRAPPELPPSNRRRLRGEKNTLPQPPSLPRPY